MPGQQPCESRLDFGMSMISVQFAKACPRLKSLRPGSHCKVNPSVGSLMAAGSPDEVYAARFQHVILERLGSISSDTPGSFSFEHKLSSLSDVHQSIGFNSVKGSIFSVWNWGFSPRKRGVHNLNPALKVF